MSKLLGPLMALALGFGAALLLVLVVGDNPLQVAGVLVSESLGGLNAIAYSLFYATPFIFTGLSVAWALKAGLFNVGAEGQMLMGGVAVVVLGILFPGLSPWLAIPLAAVGAFVAGGLWGYIAGWIKVNRGAHEVLITILLNFVAYGISGFVILNVFRNPSVQNPETLPIGDGYHIMSFSSEAPLNMTLLLALVAIGVYAVVFGKMIFGFRQRISGSAPQVALRAGVDVKKQSAYAFFIAGGLSGLASLSPIMGYAFKAREGFSSGAGFIGIAVALLGQGSPIGILLSALLFGALAKGSLNLDLDTQFITRDLAQVIQAFIIICVASQAGLMSVFKRRAS